MASNTSTDFTDVDGVFISGAVQQSVIAYEDPNTKPQTQALPPRPPKQDISNPTQFEQVPTFGDAFSQGDFSHGSGQTRYHSQNRDPQKYGYSENIDMLKPGRLRCLHDATGLASVATANIGRAVEVANDLPFVIDNGATKQIQRGDGNFPGTWTNENPFAGKGSANLEDLTSSGDQLYVAMGTLGVNVRSSAGTYTNYVSAGSTTVDRILWTKGRLMVTDGLNIYEITAAGNVLPTPIETLPTGQRFEEIFEYGSYIYACVVDSTRGTGSIHHYGTNQSLTAIEKKGETALPDGEIPYSGYGYLGGGYIGAGKQNGQGGVSALNAVIFQCVQDAQGFLQFFKLAEDQEVGTSANRAVKCITAYGESVIFGWVNSAPTGTNGTNRSGLAIHHLGQDAFAPYLQGNVMGAGATDQVTSVRVYRGRVLFVRAGIGLHYENLTKFVSGKLWTSSADFNNAGPKIWDKFEIAHVALNSGEEIDLSYSIDDGVTYTSAIANSTASSKGATTTLTTNVKNRQLSLLIDLKVPGGGATTPEFKLYSVRSNLSPATPEYVLVRNFRLFESDRKDELAVEIFGDPDADKVALEALVFSWVTFKEANKTWSAFITGVSDITPSIPEVRTSLGGDPSRKGYVVTVQMIGT